MEADGADKWEGGIEWVIFEALRVLEVVVVVEEEEEEEEEERRDGRW
eukprot:COSAG02_NODE_3417_length_6780_cov_54.323006_6_plen_47_part_00